MARWQACFCLLLAACLWLPAAQAGDRPATGFGQWVRNNDVSAFQSYLREQGIRRLPPADELVATASDWRRCGASAFEIPPRTHWPQAAATYRLLDHLHERGIVRGYRVVSTWRNPDLNACAGGASRSAHARQYAVDLIPEGAGVDMQALCTFWKREGPRWNMGLSRYPSGRIHIDVVRYRTWGADHTGATAFCR